MKVETNRGLRAGWRYGLLVSLLGVIAVTWLLAIMANPVDSAVVAGMESPQCASVGRIPAGSVLLTDPQVDGICGSYYLYRATHENAVGDARSYTGAILDARVAEFWQRIWYVLLLWLLVTGLVVGAVGIFKHFFSRHQHNM